MKPLIGLIRAFEGPMHSRLERLWEWFAARHGLRLVIFDNRALRLPHYAAMERLWEMLRATPRDEERHLVMTEFDFIPSAAMLKYVPPHPIVAPAYATRSAETKELTQYDIPGAWFLIFEADNAPSEPNFKPHGAFNDPANGLGGAALVRGVDCMPHHYGVRYPWGEHLFWSRHYNDVPQGYIVGFDLGDIIARARRRISEAEEELRP